MAAERPLLLIAEFEPAETSYVAEGSSVRSHLLSVDADSKQPVDPDTLTITIRPPYATPTTLTYGVDVAVVKNSQGNYQCDVAITKPGTWRLQWNAQLSSVGVGSNTTEIQGVDPQWW